MSITGRLAGPEAPSAEVISLDRELFPRPWTAEQWESLLVDKFLLYSWRGQQSGLLGFALFGVVPGDDVAHLYKIILRPEHRGAGEARAFWSSISQELRARGYGSVYLEVEGLNNAAIRFYEKVGFHHLRRVGSYYSDGSDALMMNLTL